MELWASRNRHRKPCTNWPWPMTTRLHIGKPLKVVSTNGCCHYEESALVIPSEILNLQPGDRVKVKIVRA